MLFLGINGVLQILTPLLIKLVLSKMESNKNLWWSLLVGIIFIIFKFLDILSRSPAKWYQCQLTRKIQGALQFVVSQKVAFEQLSDHWNRGTIENKIITDITKVTLFPTKLFQIFFLLIELIWGFIWIGLMVGFWSCLWILVLSLVSSLLMLGISFLQVKYRCQVMEARDERLKFANELTTGIRQVKYNTMEDLVQKRLEDLKKNETFSIFKDKLIDCIDSLMRRLLPFFQIMIVYYEALSQQSTIAYFQLSVHSNLLLMQLWNILIMLRIFSLLE